MKWYSNDGKTQIGPVSETDFQSLVEAGEINPETLIWEEGMPQWQPYGEITADVLIKPKPSESASSTIDATCTECGATLPQS